MDDWDAFDPDLHAALNASMQSPPMPNAGQVMQPMQTNQPAPSHPAGSETTVQSAQQVQTQAAAGQSTQQMKLQAALYGQPMQSGTAPSPRIPQGIPLFPSLHQPQTSAQQMQSPSAGNSGDAVDSTAGSDVTFRPVGAGGSSSGPNGGGTPPPFPSYAGSHQQQRQGQAFAVQVKPKDPPVFRGRVEDDVTT